MDISLSFYYVDAIVTPSSRIMRVTYTIARNLL